MELIYGGGGLGARRAADRRRQAGLHRPEAARHPQHGRARDRADRQARRGFPHRPRLSADDARGRRGREGLRAEAARRLRADLERRRRSRGGGLRLRRPRAGRAPRGAGRGDRLAGLVCERCGGRGAARRARHGFPAGDPRHPSGRAATSATRSAWRRRARRSPTARIISSSAGRSRRRADPRAAAEAIVAEIAAAL